MDADSSEDLGLEPETEQAKSCVSPTPAAKARPKAKTSQPPKGKVPVIKDKVEIRKKSKSPDTDAKMEIRKARYLEIARNLAERGKAKEAAAFVENVSALNAIAEKEAADKALQSVKRAKVTANKEYRSSSSTTPQAPTLIHI